MSQFVTLVNRTSKTLEGVWDGRHYSITPGKHEFPRIKAEKFRDQNPIMGSENRISGVRQYLIGIVEDGDDVSPTEQSNAIEMWTRTEAELERLKVVEANGLYHPIRDASPALPLDSTIFKSR